MERQKRDRDLKKREPKDRTLTMRLSKSDVELLNKISTEEDLPMAQIIRKAVKLYSNYYNAY
jgi:predicted DNA binding CopG/RHH family protein